MDVCIVELRMAAEISHSRIGPTMSDFEVRVEKRPKAAKNFDGPQQDYNIVKRTTVGGHGVKDDVITLPITSFDPSLVEDSTTRRLGQRVQSQGVRVEELVHNYFHIRKGKQIRRAIVVPTETLDNNAPSSSKSLMGMALVCVPTLQHDAVDGEISRFESLQRLIQKSERESETIDPNTIQFLWILQNWLVAGMKNKNFIPMLFHRPPARGRILLCAHNPAYFQQESQCYRNVSLSVRSNLSSESADLEEKVHKRNFMWLMVLRYEKFFLSVMNPSYNQVDIEDDTSRLYFYKGMKRVETKGRGMSAGSSSVNMTPRFPLHKAAEDDDILKMQQLLHDGYDPNERDDQNWTPLHHACFHGRQEAINMLVKSPLFTMVNAQNNGGATPLHYAVIHGNVHIIEFLTSHASIDVNIVDNSGMKPIDYCNDNTIKQFLLNGIYKSKIIVETDIGPFSVKTSTNPKQATAVQIMKELAREIRLSFKQMDCFALYVYSESLELQLPKDAVLNDCLNLQKWHSNLRKFCGQAKEEQPRLKFRRNAHATVSNELDACVDQNKFALATLFEEAMNAYKKGVLLTDNKKDTAAFAAILARKLYGRTFKPKPENVTKMYPDYMLRKDRDKLANRLGKAMKLLEDKQDDDLELEFVKMARNVITYGAWFFLVNVKLVKARAGKNGDESHVGVNDNGLHIISTQTRKVKTFQFEEFIPSGDPKNPTVLKVETRNAAFLIESPFVRFLKKILTKFHPSFEFSSQPKPVATSLSI